jgi:erythromycin esterase-like protein
MYYGSRASWNLRDSHMFQTLKTLVAFYGVRAKAIVWAHNSPVGDAAATEMSARGEYNIGHLCRKEFGNQAYSVGFGTNAGTAAAASDWDGPMEIKTVVPAIPESYERCCHESGVPAFCLSLRQPSMDTQDALRTPRLESGCSIVRKPSSSVTISRLRYRNSSMSISGWIKPRQSRRSTLPCFRTCRIRIHLEFKGTGVVKGGGTSKIQCCYYWR